MKNLYLISLIVLSHIEKWWPWLEYQVEKQFKYISKKGLIGHLIVVVPKRLESKAIEYFKVPGKLVQLVIVEDTDSIGTIRNKSIKYSLGHITAFQDQDDWYPEYRLHYQWTKLMLSKFQISTVDQFISYDPILNKFYNQSMSSESCLMFKTELAKNRKFTDIQKGEGSGFTDKLEVLIDDEVILISATEHGENITLRSRESVNKLFKTSEIYNNDELKLLKNICVD